MASAKQNGGKRRNTRVTPPPHENLLKEAVAAAGDAATAGASSDGWAGATTRMGRQDPSADEAGPSAPTATAAAPELVAADGLWETSTTRMERMAPSADEAVPHPPTSTAPEPELVAADGLWETSTTRMGRTAPSADETGPQLPTATALGNELVVAYGPWETSTTRIGRPGSSGDEPGLHPPGAIAPEHELLAVWTLLAHRRVGEAQARLRRLLAADADDPETLKACAEALRRGGDAAMAQLVTELAVRGGGHTPVEQLSIAALLDIAALNAATQTGPANPFENHHEPPPPPPPPPPAAAPAQPSATARGGAASAPPGPWDARDFALETVVRQVPTQALASVFAEAEAKHRGRWRRALRRPSLNACLGGLLVVQLGVLAIGLLWPSSPSEAAARAAPVTLQELAALFPANAPASDTGALDGERLRAEAVLYRFFDASPERAKRVQRQLRAGGVPPVAAALLVPTGSRSEDLSSFQETDDPVATWLLWTAQRRLGLPEAADTLARLLATPQLPGYLLAQVVLEGDAATGPARGRLLDCLERDASPWSRLARHLRALAAHKPIEVEATAPPVVAFACHFATALEQLGAGDKDGGHRRLQQGVVAVGAAEAIVVDAAETLLRLGRSATVQRLMIEDTWPQTLGARAVEVLVFAREQRHDDAREVLLELWAAGYRDPRLELAWLDVQRRLQSPGALPLELAERVCARARAGSDLAAEQLACLGYADGLVVAGRAEEAHGVMADRVHWFRRNAPTSLRADAYYVLAAAKHGHGDAAGASADVERALKYDPKHRRARVLKQALGRR